MQAASNPIARGLLAIAALLLVAGCNTWPTLKSRSAMMAHRTQYYAPEPAVAQARTLVILVSGCGGLVGLDGPKAIMKDYAHAANRAGAYAVVIESFNSRGISFKTSLKQVCSGLRLRGDARAGDILVGEKLAEAHWPGRFDRLVIAGWSHGGWTAMELLSAGANAVGVGDFRIDRPYHALNPDAVALFYPYCGLLNFTRFSTWDFRGPLLLVTASDDSRSTPAQCVDELTRARGGDANLEHVDFPGQTHGFDESDQVPGSTFRYDAEAAARSHALFERFVHAQVALAKAK